MNELSPCFALLFYTRVIKNPWFERNSRERDEERGGRSGGARAEQKEAKKKEEDQATKKFSLHCLLLKKEKKSLSLFRFASFSPSVDTLLLNFSNVSTTTHRVFSAAGVEKMKAQALVVLQRKREKEMKPKKEKPNRRHACASVERAMPPLYRLLLRALSLFGPFHPRLAATNGQEMRYEAGKATRNDLEGGSDGRVTRFSTSDFFAQPLPLFLFSSSTSKPYH